MSNPARERRRGASSHWSRVMPAEAPSAMEHSLKIAGVTITLVGLLAGTYQFTRNQAIEAARPFLERKLKWCEEAVEVAAGIAVHGRDSTAITAVPPPLRPSAESIGSGRCIGVSWAW